MQCSFTNSGCIEEELQEEEEEEEEEGWCMVIGLIAAGHAPQPQPRDFHVLVILPAAKITPHNLQIFLGFTGNCRQHPAAVSQHGARASFWFCLMNSQFPQVP